MVISQGPKLQNVGETKLIHPQWQDLISDWWSLRHIWENIQGFVPHCKYAYTYISRRHEIWFFNKHSVVMFQPTMWRSVGMSGPSNQIVWCAAWPYKTTEWQYSLMIFDDMQHIIGYSWFYVADMNSTCVYISISRNMYRGFLSLCNVAMHIWNIMDIIDTQISVWGMAVISSNKKILLSLLFD